MANNFLSRCRICLKLFIIVPNKIFNGEKKCQPSTVNKTKVIAKEPTVKIGLMDRGN